MGVRGGGGGGGRGGGGEGGGGGGGRGGRGLAGGWGGRRPPVPGGDRAARPHPDARGTGPRASAVRGMVAPGKSPYRCPRAASRRVPDADRDGHGRVRRTRPPRAAGHRGNRAQAHRGDPY